IEFKVHAPTQKHQSAKHAEFTTARGYCSKIRKRFSQADDSRLTFTVVSKQLEFDEDRMVKGVYCRARTWKDLIPLDGSESLLLMDLLDSLGEFGIPVLSLRKIKNMKNAKNDQGAFEIHQIMKTV